MSTTIPAYTEALSTAENCIRIGLPWTVTFNWTDNSGVTRDLTGYSATLNIMSGDQAGATLLVAATCVVGSTNPNITCSLTDAQTTALTNANSSFYLKVTDGTGHDTGIAYGPCPIVFWGAG